MNQQQNMQMNQMKGQMHHQQQQQMPGPPPPNQQNMPNPNMPMVPPGHHMQMNPNNMSIAQQYTAQTMKYIPALNPNNPHLKQQVGSCIYEFVQKLVGDEKAPRSPVCLSNCQYHRLR